MTWLCVASPFLCFRRALNGRCGERRVHEWRVEVGSGQAIHIVDVDVREVWRRLKEDRGTVLVDVRTRAEWAYVGLADLSSIGKRPILIEWQTFPDNRVDSRFVERLSDVLEVAGVGQQAELFFICRSGGRSKMAAQAAEAAGYAACRNVAGGFEGPLDADRHRGRTAGWKAAGLPWAQG
ncbi:MAG: rhodanese-like domain-containing protein [Hyphomicrobiaceae bacterium]|nr:rhodanese-like domain-containing protein [Hyphomicrobiaceae bacterium]